MHTGFFEIDLPDATYKEHAMLFPSSMCLWVDNKYFKVGCATHESAYLEIEKAFPPEYWTMREIMAFWGGKNNKPKPKYPHPPIPK